MQTHKLFIVFFIYITTLLMSNISYAECGANINEGIQKIIDEDRVKYHIPSIEVSIICPNEDFPRDFVSGTTLINGDIPITPEHLFQIGSETKSFMAAIILQLESEGRLSIQDPIGKYLADLPQAWQNITIQQLLNHTSGIFNYTDVEEFWAGLIASDFQREWTVNELLNFSFDKTPYFSPGQGWKYSNTNYILAGMIIEASTQNPIETELNNRIFAPLQLNHTYFLPHAYDADTLQVMAHGYYHSDDALRGEIDATTYNMSIANTAGAIVSTSHDTAIWLKSLLKTNSVLADTQLKEMMTRVSFKDGKEIPKTSKMSGYGLGIGGGVNTSIGKGEIWGHSGGTIGYLSNMYWLKCNDVIITTTVSYIGREDDSLLKDLVKFIQAADTNKHCASSAKNYPIPSAPTPVVASESEAIQSSMLSTMDCFAIPRKLVMTCHRHI